MEQYGTKLPGTTLFFLSEYTRTGPPGLFSRASAMRSPLVDLVTLGLERGTEMMTPLPVPSHSLLQETSRDVIRTKEKPSFPVPGSEIGVSLGGGGQIMNTGNKPWHASGEE